MAVVFLQFFKKLLSMRTSLITFSCGNVVRNEIPVFTKHLESFDEALMLVVSPAASIPTIGQLRYLICLQQRFSLTSSENVFGTKRRSFILNEGIFTETLFPASNTFHVNIAAWWSHHVVVSEVFHVFLLRCILGNCRLGQLQ
jgi:hypothetical protein